MTRRVFLAWLAAIDVLLVAALIRLSCPWWWVQVVMVCSAVLCVVAAGDEWRRPNGDDS